MEMYLKGQDTLFRFPVLPSSINVQDYAITNDNNITNLGDITMYGGKGLKTTEITSFFPNKIYEFCNYTDFPTPYDCVNQILTFSENGEVLRFIVTDTNINFECLVTNFEYSEQDGTRDVYFTISLKEYRRLSGTAINPDIGSTPSMNTTNPNTNTTGQTSYTVVEGDCLWDIAKKYYGSGAKWTIIRDKNVSKYPSLAKSTIIQPGWELIIT